MNITAQERLNRKAYVMDGHLLWGGHLTYKGYGSIWVTGRQTPTHRFAWEIAYGSIPEGLQVLHLCNTPPCILPWHLYLGTASDNLYDRVRAGNDHNANKTHCPRGHPYDEANTYHYPDGRRKCRTCNNAADRQRYRTATQETR